MVIDEFLQTIVYQAPVVAVLVYLLFRLDGRMGEMINLIIELAQENREREVTRRLSALGQPPNPKPKRTRPLDE